MMVEPLDVQFYPDLASQSEALTEWLAAAVCWQDEEIQMFGKRLKVPRQVAWFGDAGLNYRYSGQPHLAQGWPPLLRSLRDELCSKLTVEVNFVLANRYRSGADYMGWHKDDEPRLAGPVVSVSFGSTRRFHLEEPGTNQLETMQSRTKHTFELSSGSVLVHPRHWRHTLPKTAKPIAERFNLSFRQVQPIV
jgi:alkylated DNA repair dioxygenase AlkB